jgi:hypothetical protein
MVMEVSKLEPQSSVFTMLIDVSKLKPRTPTIPQDWLTEEVLQEIADTFQQIVNSDHYDMLEEFKVFRDCWDKEAMKIATRRLPKETKTKILEMIKELNQRDEIEKQQRLEAEQKQWKDKALSRRPIPM